MKKVLLVILMFSMISGSVMAYVVDNDAAMYATAIIPGNSGSGSTSGTSNDPGNDPGNGNNSGSSQPGGMPSSGGLSGHPKN